MMLLENIILVVKNMPNTKLFAVTIDGKVVVKRLFVSYKGFLCEYVKDSNKYGRRINNFNLKKWENIKPIY